MNTQKNDGLQEIKTWLRLKIQTTLRKIGGEFFSGRRSGTFPDPAMFKAKNVSG